MRWQWLLDGIHQGPPAVLDREKLALAPVYPENPGTLFALCKDKTFPSGERANLLLQV
jgi:hypothetical protein